jgi:hypothetical protein
MNERIRELAEQAGMESDILDENEGTIWWIANSDLEKFAELLIRECSQVSRDHQRVYYESHGDRIAEQIKKHFGVEE